MIADLETILAGFQATKFPEGTSISRATANIYGKLINRVIIAGGPPTKIIHSLIESSRRELKLRQEVKIARAGALAGGLVVIGLVPVSFLVALGFGLSLEVFSTTLGVALAVTGLSFIFGAVIIFIRMTGRVFQGLESVSEYALIAALLEVGMDSKTAIALSHGIDKRADDIERNAEYLQILREGIMQQSPLASKFRQAGDDLAAEQEAMIRKRIETLGTKLLLPLGGMLLPAFVVLVVIPLLLGIVSFSS